jgi:hypothetical protein
MDISHHGVSGMTRQRLFGTQLEFLLAELMAPPGKYNYNISRYVVFEGELDFEALIVAIERALLETGIVHCDYEFGSDGAWQVSSARGPCKVSIMDLQDAQDSMTRCLEMIRDDTNRIVPVLAKEEKIKVILFLLEERAGCKRWVYYHRFHHIQVDGYTGQLLVRRIAELYSAYSSHSEPRQADFLGYPTLLEEEENYASSSQFSADKAFWNEYLAEYLKRTNGALVKGNEMSAEPLSLSVSIASRTCGMTALPISSITAAIMTTLYQASGVACQMIGMTFMRRSGDKLARAMSPMVTVLPLWVDLGPGHERGAVVSQVGDAVRQIKQHQFYGGERAIRDLGYTGRRGGLYLFTVNYRVFDKNPIIFNGVDSASHIVSSGPATGINVIVSMQDDGIQLSIESIYRVIYGLEIGALVELLEGNLVAALGDDYYKRVEPVAKYGYTDLRFPASGE